MNAETVFGTNFIVLNLVLHQQHVQTCMKVIDMSQTAGSGKAIIEGTETLSHCKLSDAAMVMNLFPSIFHLLCLGHQTNLTSVLIFISIYLSPFFISLYLILSPPYLSLNPTIFFLSLAPP